MKILNHKISTSINDRTELNETQTKQQSHMNEYTILNHKISASINDRREVNET